MPLKPVFKPCPQSSQDDRFCQHLTRRSKAKGTFSRAGTKPAAQACSKWRRIGPDAVGTPHRLPRVGAGGDGEKSDPFVW
jgi:hypothetical protein